MVTMRFYYQYIDISISRDECDGLTVENSVCSEPRPPEYYRKALCWESLRRDSSRRFRRERGECFVTWGDCMEFLSHR